jgi:hypothetical protein
MADTTAVVLADELGGALTGDVVATWPSSGPTVASGPSVPFVRFVAKTTTVAVTTNNATTDATTQRLGTAPPETAAAEPTCGHHHRPGRPGWYAS